MMSLSEFPFLKHREKGGKKGEKGEHSLFSLFFFVTSMVKN